MSFSLSLSIYIYNRLLSFIPVTEIPFIMELPITPPFFFRFSSGMLFPSKVYWKGPAYIPKLAGKT